MKRLVTCIPFLLASLVHCGGAAQTQASDGAKDAGDDSSTPPTHDDPDGGFDEVDGAPGTAPASDGGCSAADPPDPEGLDTNCDGVDGVIGRDVYVNVDQGQDTNPGSPTFPMATIAAALATAATTNGSVLVSNSSGTYPVTTLSAAGNWAVYGGYPSGFVGAPNPQVTVLTAPATGLLLQGAGNVTLAHLTVQGDVPSSSAQPTAHAVRSSVAHLSLLDVILQAGDGLSLDAADGGGAGGSGVDSVGPLVCLGVTQPAYTSGACCGENGPGGTIPGNYSEAERAAPGAAGTPGTDGADATGTLSVVNGVVVGNVGQAGESNGTPGFGGATGGSGTDGETFAGGSGGSGGCPGFGGTGGASGGSSIALLVLQGSAAIQASSLETGIGGNGAAGGIGGAGGLGGWGGPPEAPGGVPLAEDVDCECGNVNNPPGNSACVIGVDPMSHGCSAFGGIGGPGGAGGHGGGGAGGWSIGAATVSGATATIDSATTTTLGSPGNGGTGNGGGQAPAGRRVATWHLD